MSLKFAKEIGLVVQSGSRVSRVRLANGKIVETVGIAQLTIIFGAYHFIGRFQLLDCEVPLILGMEFLQKVQPRIDFAKKQVAVVHKQLRYQLPTCVISSSDKSQRGSKLSCVPGTECGVRGGVSSVQNDRSLGVCRGSSCVRNACVCEKERSGGAQHVSESMAKGSHVQGQSKELKDTLEGNRFFGLEVEEAGEEPAVTIQSEVEDCPSEKKGMQVRGKRSLRRCVQCGCVFRGSG